MTFHSIKKKSQSMVIMVDKEEDRISSLSDDVLSHILSFLELREAVKTLVLSKRWEKVWTLIHRIHLDNRSCVRDFNRDMSLEEENKRRASFINFVNGVLTGNNSILYVTSFCLKFYFSWPEPTFDQEIPYLIEWLAAAITPNLQKFDFLIAGRVRRFPPIKMPPTLFECQKLVFLKIDCFYSKIIGLHLPKTVCLSSLEKLHLATIQFENENSLKNLLSGCPVLEELYMKTFERPGNDNSEINKLFVFSPSLKILRLDNLLGLSPWCYVVEAPKLEYLDFVDHSLLGFSMSASPSLVSAVIDISIRPEDRSSVSVVELFQGIFNVQKLELSTQKTIMVEDELSNLPEFCNLIDLKIVLCTNSQIVPCLLQHSPHLKHLIFAEHQFSSKSFMWIPPNPVPECLILHLEKIEILSLVGKSKKEAIKMIEYVLDKGKVLQKMAITSFPDEKDFNKLKGFPKASVRCQIVFSTIPGLVRVV